MCADIRPAGSASEIQAEPQETTVHGRLQAESDGTVAQRAEGLEGQGASSDSNPVGCVRGRRRYTANRRTGRTTPAAYRRL